jgi:alanine-synthesizing transaminase
MRSSRLPSDLSVNAATRTLDALRRQGVEVIDLTLSNPTRVGLRYPPDLLQPLAGCESLVYDPQPLGLVPAREAVARDFARRGLTVAPEHIALTASTSEAYSLLFKLLCDPGDVVLVPRPSYPLFEHLTVLESVEARPYRLEYDAVWRIDVDQMRSLIDTRVKALLIVSPNNPTGSFLHCDDFQSVAELCAAQQLVIIGDEVFADYALEPSERPISVLNRDAVTSDVVTVSLGGLSKAVGLPQLKLAWIAFAGPAERLNDFMSAYEVIADSYLSVSTPVQAALAKLLDRGAAIRDQIQSRVTRNLAALREAAVKFPSVSVLRVEGGWSAVIQVPAYRPEETLMLDLLNNDRVLVHPGFFFDFEREAFVVLSLLVEPDSFDRGISRALERATQAT